MNRKLTVTAVVLCSILSVALAATAVWQNDVHGSRLDDAESHATIAASIESGEAEGAQAGALLREYVETGDSALLVELQAHTDAGVRHLTAAVSAAGGDSNGFLDTGTQFVQTAGQVIALRQGGDIAGAAAALEALAPQFEAFIAAQNQFTAAEQAEAAALRSDADTAETNTLWLAVLSGAFGICALLAGVVTLRRGLAQRSLDTVPSV